MKLEEEFGEYFTGNCCLQTGNDRVDIFYWVANPRNLDVLFARSGYEPSIICKKLVMAYVHGLFQC